MEFRFYDQVNIPLRHIALRGELVVPRHASSIIIFSHGSGSSRHSPRNIKVSHYLHSKNFGTLLFDLLTESEDWHYSSRFDIELLTRRLITVTEWLEAHPTADKCRLGYFGASTGAAAALKAVKYLPRVGAVVSRGGRPDLVMDDLPEVQSPTLLIVGSRDQDVLQLNKEAYLELKCEKELTIVDGATHLFEEHGAMEKVCELAASWFETHLLQSSRVAAN